MNNSLLKALILSSTLALTACNIATSNHSSQTTEPQVSQTTLLPEFKSRLNIYYPVVLTADLSHLSEQQKAMLSILIDASKIMDDLFWQQSYGKDYQQMLDNIADDHTRRFAEINYGPWDRLQGDQAFLSGVAEKPTGAQFYPHDMSKQELQSSQLKDASGLYSIVVRDKTGSLTTVPYSEYYNEALTRAAKLLQEAAKLAENQAFANYLNMRAAALLSDDYQASDFAWMDMKDNPIELVYGPIETYEDQLLGYRAAFESYVLIKDLEWSKRLEKYAQFLPKLQQGLPVSAKYKQEMPGANADLNAYDVIYYAGHSNAGSKTIAINLPNDEQVQLEKGTRRLQLKNAMRAKFDHILLPIAEQLIVPEQRKHVTFNAFFANTMFHEVAHGLGIKNTLTGKGTVRGALLEHASALEEGKADILGLYMVRQLLEQGEISEGVLADYYVTFMAGIFRSSRFGASSAHGKANMVRFNYFQEQGVFARNEQGQYLVNLDKMGSAVDSLSELILTLQGDGNYDAVDALVQEKGIISPTLKADLNKLANANIPVDITFKQGKAVLGLR